MFEQVDGTALFIDPGTDIEPQGAIRFIALTPSVLSLLLVVLSAAFAYLEVERHCR